MTAKNTPAAWGSVSQILHWLIALLILALGVVGLTMGELPKTPKYFWVYTAHKSIGITVLALVLFRLGWRLYAGAPKPVPGESGRVAARALSQPHRGAQVDPPAPRARLVPARAPHRGGQPQRPHDRDQPGQLRR